MNTRVPTDGGALGSLYDAVVEEARKELVRYEPTGDDFLTWATKYRTFRGKPFSLAGHEYLKEPYSSFFHGYEYVVFQKAAQMGASELALTWSLYMCDRHPRSKVIFFLPSDPLVNDFSHDRLAPVLEDSPRLSQIVGDVDNVGYKRIGHSSLYLRGMFSKAKTKSIDADCLIFDELDEVKRQHKQQAIERISHSQFRYVMELSTPTLPDYGIDEVWQETDERYWHLACRCPEGVILEDSFPECVGERNGEFFLRCPTCGKENLHPCEPARMGEYVGWLPKHPEREKRGYHLTQLFSVYMPLAKLMKLWHSGKDREEFHNSKLGMPYAGDRMPLTLAVLRACVQEGLGMPEPRRLTPHEKIFIGADQGLEMHIVVTKLLENGRRQTLWLERTKYGGANDPFARLRTLIQKLNPTCCVIDLMPNCGPARQLAEEFRNVYVCSYSETAKQKIQFDKKTRRVIAHRTDLLDDMVDDWLVKEYIACDHPEQEVAFSHLKSLAKVNETDPDTGITVTKYIHIGPDHFGHAYAYERAAASYPYGKSHFDIL